MDFPVTARRFRRRRKCLGSKNFQKNFGTFRIFCFTMIPRFQRSLFPAQVSVRSALFQSFNVPAPGAWEKGSDSVSERASESGFFRDIPQFRVDVTL